MKQYEYLFYFNNIDGNYSIIGVGAEIMARIMETDAFFQLDAPAWRITGSDIPMPYTKSLELAALPSPVDVVTAVTKILNVK